MLPIYFKKQRREGCDSYFSCLIKVRMVLALFRNTDELLCNLVCRKVIVFGNLFDRLHVRK